MIRIDINNSYIRLAFQNAYNKLYDPAQRQYDFVNNRELYDFWTSRVLELLCDENMFTIENPNGNLFPVALIFEDEPALTMFKIRHSN